MIISVTPPSNEKTAEVCMIFSTSASSCAPILKATKIPVEAETPEIMFIRKLSIGPLALIAPIAIEPLSEKLLTIIMPTELYNVCKN
jgi:hypothetical protein